VGRRRFGVNLDPGSRILISSHFSPAAYRPSAHGPETVRCRPPGRYLFVGQNQ